MKNKKRLFILPMVGIIAPVAALVSCNTNSNNKEDKKMLSVSSVITKSNTEIQKAFKNISIISFKGTETEKVITKLFTALLAKDMVANKAIRVDGVQYSIFTVDQQTELSDIIKNKGKINPVVLADVLNVPSHARSIQSTTDVPLLVAAQKKVVPKTVPTTGGGSINDWNNDQFNPGGSSDPMKTKNIKSDSVTFLLSPNHKSNILSHWNMIINAKVGDRFRFNWDPLITSIVKKIFAFSNDDYLITDSRFWREITPAFLEQIKKVTPATLLPWLEKWLPDAIATRMTGKVIKKVARTTPRTVSLAINNTAGWHLSFRYGYTIPTDKFNMVFGGKTYQLELTTSDVALLEQVGGINGAGKNGNDEWRDQMAILAYMRHLFITRGHELKASGTLDAKSRPSVNDVNTAFGYFAGSQHVKDRIIKDYDYNDPSTALIGMPGWHSLFHGGGGRTLPKAGQSMKIKVGGKIYKYEWTAADATALSGYLNNSKTQGDVVNYIIGRFIAKHPTLTKKDIFDSMSVTNHNVKVV